MAWTGKASAAEMKAVLQAISVLEGKEHIQHMSYAMISKTTHTIKETAVRWIIPELVDAGYLLQITIGEKKVPRYFYKLTDAGRAFMEASDEQNKGDTT